MAVVHFVPVFHRKRQSMQNLQERTLYSVVVADDEDELRESVCSMVPWEELGFRLVGSASNGLDALELVEEKEPDLLLTDIRMPFISGIELARQVREIRPVINIAFLSGYDDFEYAKQAIQYNIISYMLKPLTIDGLAAELRSIRQKIDDRFAVLRQATAAFAEQDARSAFLMPLVLDDYSAQEAGLETQALVYARQCGLLRDAEDTPHYVVLVASLVDGAGNNVTRPSFVAAVDTVAGKYLRHACFFSVGRVITVLLGNPSDYEEYLHILADEIPQVAARVLGLGCCLGVSRQTDRLIGLHAAYREAMEALRSRDPQENGARFIGDLRPADKGGSLLCRRALQALDQHYMDADLSLVSLSGMLEVSPNYLSAVIKKYAGETFINILIRKRMEAARTLLLTSSLKIQDIARQCGYLDQHYFSYCFKKYSGVSPNALRRQHSAQAEGTR